jgi:transcriptional regulator with XRE-family HTH domain
VKELPDRWRDLGEFIREQRSSSRLSLRRLSELAGISNPYLSQIERGLRKPSAEILQSIAKALRISAETLYVRAGILEERDIEHDLMGEILRDSYLTEDQKQTLIKVYLSFRHENQDQVVSPSPEADPDGEPADEPAPAAEPEETGAG